MEGVPHKPAEKSGDAARRADKKRRVAKVEDPEEQRAGGGAENEKEGETPTAEPPGDRRAEYD
jgi:hypothetical protein